MCCQQLNGCQYSQTFEKKNVSDGEIEILDVRLMFPGSTRSKKRKLPLNKCVAYAEEYSTYMMFSCNAAGDTVTNSDYGIDSTCAEMNKIPDGVWTSSNASFECNVTDGEIHLLYIPIPIALNRCLLRFDDTYDTYDPSRVSYGILSCNGVGDIVTVESYGTDSTCNETNATSDTAIFYTAANASFECTIIVDYYTEFNLSSIICAKNRDPSTPLCARCKQGTYELFGTTSCGNNCNKWINILFIIPI
eukprot:326067_1